MLRHNLVTHLGLQFSNNVHSTLFSPKITLPDREDRSKWKERSSACFMPSINIMPWASSTEALPCASSELKALCCLSLFYSSKASAYSGLWSICSIPDLGFSFITSVSTGLTFHLLTHILFKPEFLRGSMQPPWL